MKSLLKEAETVIQKEKKVNGYIFVIFESTFYLNSLQLLPEFVHLPGVLVPLGVTPAERLLDLVELLLYVFILRLCVLQLGPQPIDLALGLLNLHENTRQNIMTIISISVT